MWVAVWVWITWLKSCLIAFVRRGRIGCDRMPHSLGPAQSPSGRLGWAGGPYWSTLKLQVSRETWGKVLNWAPIIASQRSVHQWSLLQKPGNSRKKDYLGQIIKEIWKDKTSQSLRFCGMSWKGSGDKNLRKYWGKPCTMYHCCLCTSVFNLKGNISLYRWWWQAARYNWTNVSFVLVLFLLLKTEFLSCFPLRSAVTRMSGYEETSLCIFPVSPQNLSAWNPGQSFASFAICSFLWNPS